MKGDGVATAECSAGCAGLVLSSFSERCLSATAHEASGVADRLAVAQDGEMDRWVKAGGAWTRERRRVDAGSALRRGVHGCSMIAKTAEASLLECVRAEKGATL
jgi:hypothetical protein